MNDNETFTDFVDHICRRPQMYVRGGSFFEVCAYVSGYAHASPDCPLGGEGRTAFNEFVCAAFRFPSKYVWSFVIKECCSDDHQAIERLRELLIEFAERSETESYRTIVEDMLSRTSDQEEGEPEKTWRRFSSAILRGRREEIAPLLQEHADADILWAGAYPDDVAPLLDDIAKFYPVTRISGSEAEGSVTVITPDFGPVGLKLVDGTWRVDAAKIIGCWKTNRGISQQQDRPGK
jgi:hypothetical protein